MNLSELGPRFPQSISLSASFFSRFLHPHSLHCTSWPMSSKGTRDRGGNMFFCSCLLWAKLFSSCSSEGRGREGEHSRWSPSPVISRGWFSGCWLGNGKGIEPKCSNTSYVSISLSQDSCSRNCQWSVTWCHLVSPQSLRSFKFMLLLARTLISPQKSCQYLQWGNQWLSSIRSTADWLDVPTQMCLRRENTHTKTPCTFPRIWTYRVQCLIFQMQPILRSFATWLLRLGSFFCVCPLGRRIIWKAIWTVEQKN